MEQNKCQCECHKHQNDPNNPHHHHHHHSKKHFHIRKTLLSKTYIMIFLICTFLLIGIGIINFIFLILKIFIPRIFFPGIIIYIASFIFAGGIVGSYGPVNKSEPQLMQMRKCSSIIMLFICIGICPIFLYQNINFYSNIKKAKLFCLENNGKARGDIYNELAKEKESVFSLRNNFEFKFRNGLTCFENQKCIKGISNSKMFVCNYNYEEKVSNTAKCNKIFETDNLINSFDDANMGSFASSCIELKKDKIRPNIELFRCISSKNLCKEDSNTEEEKIEIEKYHTKKIEIYNKDIIGIQQKLDNLDADIYFYEDKCYSNSQYFIFFICIIAHILINLFICIAWIILGISNILKSCGCMEDSELMYYQQKMKTMNNLYNQIHLSKENQNEIDETTPINIK